MAMTIADMASRGKAKLRAKAPTMKANYDAKKAQMKANYGNLPFGPLTTAAYNRGIDAASYRTPDLDKWDANWRAAVAR